MMRSASIAALLLLGACASAPKPPPLEAPAAWRNAPSAGAPAQAGAWWLGFGDPTLNRLEARAQAGNLTLEAALARIDQSRAALRGVGALREPSAQVQGAAARVRQSERAGLGVLSRYVPDLPRDVDSRSLSLAPSWDLDFTGTLRSRSAGARADLGEAQAGLDAARLGVSAELADAYFSYRGAEIQARATDQVAQDLLAQITLTQARVEAGAQAPLALDTLQARRSQVLAQAAALGAEIEAQRSRIAVLVGVSPSAPLDLSGGFTPPPFAPTLATPQAVLRGRPDIRAAEARLAAADAQVAAALSEYYPKISIGGAVGFDRTSGGLFDPEAFTSQAGLQLRWRLFDFRRIDAEVAGAKGRHREALAGYREAVLKATGEIETNLAALEAARARRDAVKTELAALGATRERAEASFGAGAASRDGLLSAAASEAEAAGRLARAETDLARALVAVARSLGMST